MNSWSSSRSIPVSIAKLVERDLDKSLDGRKVLRELYRVNLRLLELESIRLARPWTQNEHEEFDQLNRINEKLSVLLNDGGVSAVETEPRST